MLTHGDRLSRSEAVMVGAIERAIPAVATARDLVERFHCMVRARTPDVLPSWNAEATASMLAPFGRGIAADAATVRAALGGHSPAERVAELLPKVPPLKTSTPPITRAANTSGLTASAGTQALPDQNELCRPYMISSCQPGSGTSFRPASDNVEMPVVAHSGATLAPVLGRLAAQEILGGKTSSELEAFRPTRFPLDAKVEARGHAEAHHDAQFAEPAPVGHVEKAGVTVPWDLQPPGTSRSG